MRPSNPRILRRRNKTGAALVEAVVVIPFFIIIFASVLFIGNLYKEKLRVMRLVKESAWGFAMENCGTRGDPITTEDVPSSDGAPGSGHGPSESASPADLSDAKKAGGNMAGLASKKSGSSEASMTASVSTDFGGGTKEVRSYTRVMCNEAPYDGNLLGFLKAAWQSITNW